MSITITEAHVKQYTDSVHQRFQQSGSKLRGACRQRPCTGKVDFWERIGPTESYEITTRYGDTQIIDVPHSRRKVTMKDWGWAALVDPIDVIRVLIDPQSEYVQNVAKAMGRRFDRQLITAFDADAESGEEGTTTVTFASDWTTTRGAGEGDEDFSGAALTLADIVTIKTQLDEKDVDVDGRHIAVSPEAVAQLLSQSTVPNVTSSDYSSLQALQRGALSGTFLSFEWHVSTLLPSPASDMRYCYAWHRNAMAMSIGQEIRVEVDKRPDKNNNMQVFSRYSLNATRIDGDGVVRFKIDETN